MKFPTFLTTMLSGRDNRSLDIGRVLWLLFSLAFTFLEIHRVVWLHQEFHPMDFAQAAGILLAAGGVGLGVKAATEPTPGDHAFADRAEDRAADRAAGGQG